MDTPTFPPSVFDFLSDLARHNNRDWFNTHKDRYRAEHAKVIDYAEEIIARVGSFDVLEPTTGKKSLFRIYRDTRFSQNKAPYKTHFSGRLMRSGPYRRGGFYFHFEPGDKTIIAGGFWKPESADLKRIRQELAADPEPVRKLIADPAFVETFGELKGEQVKTAPKGYKKDHPAIDLLRYKQYLLIRSFTDEEVLQPGFIDEIGLTFNRMLPFFDHITTILTTDENGVPIEGLE